MKAKVTYFAFLLLISVSISPIWSQDLFPVTRLTRSGAIESFPAWSAGGDRLVFSCIDLLDTARTGLWSITPEGTGATQIIRGLAEHPDCSPDGHYIVFDADTGNHIKIVAASGGSPIRFLPDSIRIFRGGTPCWSPDGSSIAFRSGYRLLVSEIRSGLISCIFHSPGFLPIPSCWSPDGSSVIATVVDENNHESAITRISVPDKSVKELTSNKEHLYRYADVSPDGTLLIFTSKESGNYHLWVMPLEGGRALQLSSESPGDDGPRWSPDGNSIAFVSARSGNADIWVMSLDMEELIKKVEALNGE